MSLERENQQYGIHLTSLLGPNDENEGKYTVIRGDVLNGPYSDYEEALEFGYAAYGLKPFLVKKIERNETVMYFSRDLR